MVGCPKVTDFVVLQQGQSIDFLARNAMRLAKLPASVPEEVLSLPDACLY